MMQVRCQRLITYRRAAGATGHGTPTVLPAADALLLLHTADAEHSRRRRRWPRRRHPMKGTSRQPRRRSGRRLQHLRAVSSSRGRAAGRWAPEPVLARSLGLWFAATSWTRRSPRERTPTRRQPGSARSS